MWQKAVGVGSINTIDKAKVYETPVAPNVIKKHINWYGGEDY